MRNWKFVIFVLMLSLGHDVHAKAIKKYIEMEAVEVPKNVVCKKDFKSNDVEYACVPLAFYNSVFTKKDINPKMKNSALELATQGIELVKQDHADFLTSGTTFSLFLKTLSDANIKTFSKLHFIPVSFAKTSENETGENLLHRVHRILIENIRLGFAPVIGITAQKADYENDGWVYVKGHALTLIAIQSHLSKNATSFSTSVLDPDNGTINDMMIMSPTKKKPFFSEVVSFGQNNQETWQWSSIPSPYLMVESGGFTVVDGKWFDQEIQILTDGIIQKDIERTN